MAGGDDLKRLAEYLPTDGWEPIDARVHVSSVVRIVEHLGGRSLYGAVSYIPLRELIQNAADAVRARRIVEQRADDWGQIVVRLSDAECDGEPWLEVEDTGIGMSSAVLVNHLLDFGSSFWDSRHVLEELPGLLAGTFEPTGQFGIGFFSIFMWADTVRVTSRRYDAAQPETFVLEFMGGLLQRPLLRRATRDERLVDSGTRIRVYLDEVLLWRLGIDANAHRVMALAKLLGWLCPALGVDLHAEVDDKNVTAVAASDWLKLPIDELGNRIRQSPVRLGPIITKEELDTVPVFPHRPSVVDSDAKQWDYETVPPNLSPNVRSLTTSDDTTVGRLLLNPLDDRGGLITTGGFRTMHLRMMTGILTGRTTMASRQAGVPLVPPEVLADWATEQARLLAGQLPEQLLLMAARCVRWCGGDTGPLPIALTTSGVLTRNGVQAWASALDEVVLVQDETLERGIALGSS